jgi:predicted nucleic acid-binding protein
LGVWTLSVHELIVERAASAAGPKLRSHDAIRLARALSIESEITAFVVYDPRLHEAAEAESLAVVAPGSST